MIDFSLHADDYKLWDLKDEFTVADAAALWLDLNPKICVSYRDKNVPSYVLEITYHTELPHDIRAKIATILEVFEEARKKGLIDQTTPTGPTAWMAQPFTPKFSRDGLKNYAERNGFKPKFLFPEKRLSAEAEKIQAETRATIEYFANNPEREADLKKWDLENFFTLKQAAALWHEIEPSTYFKNSSISEVVEMASALLGGNKITDKFNKLLFAAKRGELKRTRFPVQRHPTAYIMGGTQWHRDTLRAFAESTGNKEVPRFLLTPKERKNAGKQKRQTEDVIAANDRIDMLAKLPKETTVKEAAHLLKRTERTIRQWLKDGKLPGDRNPGGRDWVIHGTKDSQTS